MMGRLATPERLFYDFCLDDHVPADHLLRRIDRFVDLDEVRRELKPYYSPMGRPSVDPELMIRMLIVGYCFAIRSERRLCEEVHLNLAYRWFCRLGLDGKVPDHSTFSLNRNGRFRDSDLLRRVFEMVVRRCMDEGLVGGEGFAVDASLIQADANKQRSVAGEDWRIEDIPADAGRAVRDYLARLDDAAFGAASEVVPKFISPSDPGAQWTGALKGAAFFAYADNYLIDTANAVIVDVEATRAIRQAEAGAARTMIDRVVDRFGLKPRRLIGDTAYGAAPMLAWLVNDRGIAPHIPVFDKSARQDGTFSRSDFTYDAERDRYICPAGKELKRYRLAGRMAKAKPPEDGLYRYRASKADCDNCLLKQQCCPREPMRKVLRSVHEQARDVARAIAATPAYEELTKAAQEGGDAVCPSQAHPEVGPAAPARTLWRPGRVLARCHRPEPEKTRQAEATATATPDHTSMNEESQPDRPTRA